ncbi:MAG: PhoH family protein [Verrucomicrobiae bacterium]|nr:PhoH family protein [Verrucomicrobiae bacterium]
MPVELPEEAVPSADLETPRVNRKNIGKNTRSKKKSRSKDDALRFDGLKAPSPTGKNFVLDTNVLLHDPDCIHCFADNHVCIPIEVLCELDRFKTERTERGANARAAHRKLAELFSSQPELATRGIVTQQGGTLRLVNCSPSDPRARGALDQLLEVFTTVDTPDHRLLLCTQVIAQVNSTAAVLVTKDLNLQLKAHALGVPCGDYLNDKVDHDNATARRLPPVELEPDQLQRFASSGSIELSINDSRLKELVTNDYVLFSTGDRRTMPARLLARRKFIRLNVPESLRVQKGIAIRPLNLGQQCFIDALLNPEISLVTCYGQAGTGKTLLAVASALHATLAGDYAGVTVSRPVVPLGDTLGFLPGSLDEKLHPWLKPIFDALELITTPSESTSRNKNQRKPAPSKSPASSTAQPKAYQSFLDSGMVEIEALCYIRGRSIPNRFFILDEAQQLTPLEAKTIVTRMARGSKLVMVGDPAQIDNPYVDRLSNGLVYTRERLKGQPCAAHVTLERGERSPLAEAAARLM